MTFPANTAGIYCPGCQPGDFAQPHICGIPSNVAAPTLTVWPSILTIPEPQHPCDHCFCLKQKAGVYRVPNLTGSFDYRRLKSHKVCCGCGNRRLVGKQSEG